MCEEACGLQKAVLELRTHDDTQEKKFNENGHKGFTPKQGGPEWSRMVLRGFHEGRNTHLILEHCNSTDNSELLTNLLITPLSQEENFPRMSDSLKSFPLLCLCYYGQN